MRQTFGRTILDPFKVKVCFFFLSTKCPFCIHIYYIYGKKLVLDARIVRITLNPYGARRAIVWQDAMGSCFEMTAGVELYINDTMWKGHLEIPAFFFSSGTPFCGACCLYIFPFHSTWICVSFVQYRFCCAMIFFRCGHCLVEGHNHIWSPSFLTTSTRKHPSSSVYNSNVHLSVCWKIITCLREM